jgi:hypothetical protein
MYLIALFGYIDLIEVVKEVVHIFLEVFWLFGQLYFLHQLFKPDHFLVLAIHFFLSLLVNFISSSLFVQFFRSLLLRNYFFVLIR